MTHNPRFWRFVRLFGINPAWMGAFLLLILSASAHAEVWGFVDGQGVSHFAAEPLDGRYTLFFRGDDVFDTTDRPAGGQDASALAAAATAAEARLPASTLRLRAWFEAAPGYKAVQQHLREAASTYQIDYELLKALIATESGFVATAVSPKGAVGLMQLMPATAGRYGVAADRRASVEQKLADPRTNIRAGTRYLGDLIKLFPGQLELALAAYNAGEGAVQRAGNRIPNYRETQNYVKTVMQLYTGLKPPPAVAVAPVLTPLPAAGRVRMTLPTGRSNMIPSSLSAQATLAGADLRETSPQ
jgi:hypothetical protein